MRTLHFCELMNLSSILLKIFKSLNLILNKQQFRLRNFKVNIVIAIIFIGLNSSIFMSKLFSIMIITGKTDPYNTTFFCVYTWDRNSDPYSYNTTFFIYSIRQMFRSDSWFFFSSDHILFTEFILVSDVSNDGRTNLKIKVDSCFL